MICRFAPLLLTLFAFASRANDTRLTSNEVARVLMQAIARAEKVSPHATIAVVDREGFVLGAWSVDGTVRALDLLDAITKAGTASFLSSDQHAFTSRTAGFIVQQHFPPAIRNRPNGPLVGVNFSNMSFTDVNRFKNPNLGRNLSSTDSGTNGAAIDGPAPLTGLAGSPGGVPLFRDGRLVGGVGVAGTTNSSRRSPFPALSDIQIRTRRDADEDIALAGQVEFKPAKGLFGSHVFIDGIRVPYVNSKSSPAPTKMLGAVGAGIAAYPIVESPVVAYPSNLFGGQFCEIRAPNCC